MYAKEDEAYAKGFMARMLRDNPYKRGSDLWKDWKAGFKHANLK